MTPEEVWKVKRGSIVMSRNSTTGFIFVGVVLKEPDYRGYAQVQYVSSYDGLQNWAQSADMKHNELIGKMPDWAEWNTCDV